MNKKLPFELHKKHKKWTKDRWRYKYKMKFTNEDFEMYIYPEYIKATNCDLCDNEFESCRDRQLDHNHKTGEIRNIVCQSCNQKKKDLGLRKNNTSGYKGITKKIDIRCKEGFTWLFQVCLNGKNKSIKTCVDKKKLIKFAENWKKENNYYT